MTLQSHATQYHEGKFGRRFADGMPWERRQSALPCSPSMADMPLFAPMQAVAREEAAPIARRMVETAEATNAKRREKFLNRIEKNRK